ncbi:hypothetical protein [uncultured Kriegella sp.]|mgnify:CR=1 FL=1|uniref:hypothetical protein n=1 Tax=uncultured Kriegella sp. TaxID=1798910 RepID=UPI0030DD29BB
MRPLRSVFRSYEAKTNGEVGHCESDTVLFVLGDLQYDFVVVLSGEFSVMTPISVLLQ